MMRPMADVLSDVHCFHPYLRLAGLGCMVRGQWGRVGGPCQAGEAVCMEGLGRQAGSRMEARMGEASVC